MKRLITSVLLLSSIMLNAKTITLDENFKKALLKYDFNGNGTIEVSEIDTIKYLDVSNCNIKSLKGIKYFKKLEVLICSNNSLETIVVSKNKKLLYLDCSNNPLIFLDVSKIKLNTLYTSITKQNIILNKEVDLIKLRHRSI